MQGLQREQEKALLSINKKYRDKEKLTATKEHATST